ncbi:MAG TPA: R3H domain-containing nucleic acid-binding protein [Polyangiaceae bacterium]|nr:R3H domain-containing nucleic acid-binding protein [Polyangiaceae bacterium]
MQDDNDSLDQDVDTTVDERPKGKPREKMESAEPADERVKQARDFLISLVNKMQMDCEVVLHPQQEEAPSDIKLEITGRDAGRIIGKKGQVLSAIQFLCNRVVNRPTLERRYVTVDAEGYRNRREDSLATMARRLGKQAMTDGKIITFEPMSPRDRRVVHLALAKFEGVVTKSEGEGDDRRVQIIPVRKA